MSSSATSSQSPAFTKAQYFTRSAGGWYCNICTPDDCGRIMSAQDALNHERDSAKHGQNIADAEMWWCPAPNASAWGEDAPMTYEEMKMRESQIRVDHVRDMIPFWMRGVEAAERGEVLKMEEFLENLKRDPWGIDGDPWGYAYSPGAWGEEGGGEWGKEGIDDWGRGSSVHGRKGPSRRLNDKGNCPTGWQVEDAYDFVEDIARREAADSERRRRMHNFFEMKTQDKIEKIEEVIRFLRKTR